MDMDNQSFNKELTKEMEKYFFGCTASITITECYKMAEHFAKWGAEYTAKTNLL